METTPDATYLGVGDGLHRWDDGMALPFLYGFDDPEDDPDDVDDTRDEEESPAKSNEKVDKDDDFDDTLDPRSIHDPKLRRVSRQAAKFRTQRNAARSEADELRLQIAFLKAAGGKFVDNDAAWRLADQSMVSFDAEGKIVGAAECVDALAEKTPFLLVPDQDEVDGDEPEPTPANPFAGRSSGRVMNSKRKDASNLDRAALERRYPALRRGR